MFNSKHTFYAQQLYVFCSFSLIEADKFISVFLHKIAFWDLTEKLKWTHFQSQNSLPDENNFTKINQKSNKVKKIIKKFLSKTIGKLRDKEEPEEKRQTHKLPVLVFLPIMGRRCKGKEC